MQEISGKIHLKPICLGNPSITFLLLNKMCVLNKVLKVVKILLVPVPGYGLRFIFPVCSSPLLWPWECVPCVWPDHWDHVRPRPGHQPHSDHHPRAEGFSAHQGLKPL